MVELYVALDEEYISTNEFKPARHLASKYQERKVTNPDFIGKP